MDLTSIPNAKPQVEADAYQKPSLGEIRSRLTAQQFAITQMNDTERPFENAFWDHEELGIYVDIVTGEPLFLSTDKFDSGCGWPSFTRPIQGDVVRYEQDDSLFIPRIEVQQSWGQPLRTCLLRWTQRRRRTALCINSGALEFIPYDQMEARGYGKFMSLLQ